MQEKSSHFEIFETKQFQQEQSTGQRATKRKRQGIEWEETPSLHPYSINQLK